MGLSAEDVAISPQMALRTNPPPSRLVTAPPQASFGTAGGGLRGLLFKFGVRLRHRLYDRGLLKQKEGALPTVVLGNVTVGGTGKTPHLKVLLQRLMDRGQGERWAVLSGVRPKDHRIPAGRPHGHPSGIRGRAPRAGPPVPGGPGLRVRGPARRPQTHRGDRPCGCRGARRRPPASSPEAHRP